MNISYLAATSLFGFEVPLTELFAYGAGLFVILFALPTFISLLRQRGLILGPLLMILLGVFALAFETIALKTGLPYGKYSYDTVLGNQILGSTPWTIGIAYPILLLAAFWLASKISKGLLRPLLTAIFAVITIAVIDPAAVKLQLWKWESPGPFFGVPLTHFAGWFAAGLVGAWFIQLFWGEKEVKRGLAFSGVIMLWFWAGVNAGVNQWIPAAIGIAISIAMFVGMRLERRAEKATD